MAGKNGQVNIGAGTFPSGSKIQLNERIGDGERTKGGKNATIAKDGTASFSGLEPGQQYWVVGEDELGRPLTVAATAKAPGEPPRRPIRDPESVRNELRDRAVDQGSVNAPPVEGMRSSANVAPRSPDQAQRNRETMESAQRTAEALRKQDLVGAQVDRNAAAHAGLVTVVDGAGAASIVQAAKPAGSAKGTGGTATGGDAAARKRSAASKKAAATRKRNAARRAKSSSSSSSGGKKS